MDHLGASYNPHRPTATIDDYCCAANFQSLLNLQNP